MLSGEARWTGAGVPTQTVDTLAAVQTTWAELHGTLINIYFTPQTSRTRERRIFTQLYGTRIYKNRQELVCTFGARRARAGKTVDQVNAGASMKTRIWLALVNIIFTVHTLITCLTLKDKEKDLYIRRQFLKTLLYISKVMMDIPGNCIPLDNLHRSLHFCMGWTNTHPPPAHSNCQYNLSDIDTGACCLCSYSVPHSYRPCPL